MSPKGSRTVWSGGKDEDNIKVLPIAIEKIYIYKIELED